MMTSALNVEVARSRERLTRRVKGLPSWARWSVSAYPPGHYHSPLPDVAAAEAERAGTVPETVPGIDSRRPAQLALLEELAGYYAEMPFRAQQTERLRYWLDCTWFAHGDGVALYSMLRHLRPRRYVEVGSGFSSACALDTSELFLDGSVEFTFIDPNPERLRGLLRSTDRAEVIDQPVTHYRPEDFAQLEAGDVLFIDSSHVVKYGSEVNDLFMEVIPSLPAGVHVHIHDIFWPFTYPVDWIRRRRAWNEAYLLRALLVDNPRLQITWFNNFLGHFEREAVGAALPAWAVDPGSSVWLETR